MNQQPMTNTPPIRLIAADLDGTVLNHKQEISPRVARAFKMAAEQGVYVTIATGRNVASARKFVAPLSVNAPTLTLQGGVLYDVQKEKLISEVRLPHELACEMIEFGKRHPTWQTVIYHLNRTYITGFKFDEKFYFDLLTDHRPIIVNDLCEALNETDPDKVLFVLDPSEAAAGLRELSAAVGDRGIVVQSHAMFVEVNHPEAHKGMGLSKLAAYLGIPQSQVMAIGDQDNDKTMLEWAGLGVAMGNAPDAIKQVANWVAPSVNEDGAAAAIEKFVLK